MKLYKKNLKKLIQGNVYDPKMEHDACGVGLVASTDGRKSRKIVEYGIEALKAVWHRGAVDADGKTGDGAGIHVEIPSNFLSKKLKLLVIIMTIPKFVLEWSFYQKMIMWRRKNQDQ